MPQKVIFPPRHPSFNQRGIEPCRSRWPFIGLFLPLIGNNNMNKNNPKDSIHMLCMLIAEIQYDICLAKGFSFLGNKFSPTGDKIVAVIENAQPDSKPLKQLCEKVKLAKIFVDALCDCGDENLTLEKLGLK